MTTLDHPTDHRDRIMDAVREVIDTDHAAAKTRRMDQAVAAHTVHLPDVLRVLEQYGTDTTAGQATWGVCTDPAHALAWITTAEGFAFEIVESGPATECWLLHPLTGERVYRIDYQATWENAARAIHAADTASQEPWNEPEPAVHPAEVLVDALRAFVESIGGRDVGF